MTDPEPDEFELPEDPAELVAWMKNFADKLPEVAAAAGISPEEVRAMQEAFAGAEAEQEAKVRADVERRLCSVPDAWPPPPALRELMHAIPSLKEPERAQMSEELELWTGAIERARSPHSRPELQGANEGKLIRLHVVLPEPTKWARLLFRPRGAKAWKLLAIVRTDYLLAIDPPHADEDWTDGLEFVALGLLAREDPHRGCGAAHGAPSAVLSIALASTLRALS